MFNRVALTETGFKTIGRPEVDGLKLYVTDSAFQQIKALSEQAASSGTETFLFGLGNFYQIGPSEFVAVLNEVYEPDTSSKSAGHVHLDYKDISKAAEAAFQKNKCICATVHSHLGRIQASGTDIARTMKIFAQPETRGFLYWHLIYQVGGDVLAYRMVGERPVLHHGFFIVPDDFTERFISIDEGKTFPISREEIQSLPVLPMPGTTGFRLSKIAVAVIFLLGLGMGRISLLLKYEPETAPSAILLEMADRKTGEQAWDDALFLYQIAKEKAEKPQDKLRAGKGMLSSHYHRHLAIGREGLSNQDWEMSLVAFQEAKKSVYNNVLTDEIDGLINETHYQKSFYEGETCLKKKEWRLAKISFQDCLSFKPDDMRVKQRIREIEEHLNNEQSMRKIGLAIQFYRKALEYIKAWVKELPKEPVKRDKD